MHPPPDEKNGRRERVPNPDTNRVMWRHSNLCKLMSQHFPRLCKQRYWYWFICNLMAVYNCVICFKEPAMSSKPKKQVNSKAIEKPSSTSVISDKDTIFLDTCVYKGNRFRQRSTFDVQTHYKPTETCQCTHFAPATHQGSVKASSKAASN